MRRHTSSVVVAALLICLATLTAGCGSDSDQPSDTTDVRPLSVPEVLESDPSGPVMVRGLLFDDGTQLLLCDALAESFPPQCPGPSLPIVNPGGVDADFTTEGGVRWTDQPVTLTGVVDDGRLEIRP